MAITSIPPNSIYLIKRLINVHVKPYFKHVIGAAICMVLVAATGTLQVWLVQPALDKIFLARDSKMLLYIPVITIIISVIKGISSYYQNYLMRFVGQRVITDLQLKLFAHLIYADLSFLNDQSSGKLISRFTNDIALMRGAVSNLLTGMAKELLTVLFLIILMFYQSVTLSLISFIVFPVAVIPIIKMGKKMRKLSNATQEELGNYTAKLDDSFQAIRVIKSYRQEENEVSKARGMIEKIFRLYVKAIKTDSLSSPIMETLSGIAIAAVIWYGGMQVVNGETSAGGFFSFIAAFITAYKPLKSLAGLNTSLQEGLAAANRIFNIFDIEPKIVNHPSAKPVVFQGGKVSFSDVEYAYSSGKEALRGLNLEVNPGETVALVGPSGGGKSTIANLLMRFYDPSKGTIYIDSQDIRTVTMESLRDLITIVTQEVMLFDDSILANIAYGKNDASKEEVVEAAKAAAAHDFILELPQGYETMIGQHGLKLSGGQRQRISIARAILKNSPILILDEATAALDTISERHIQANLRQVRKNLTTLIVAHRLSTIIDADKIYVIKDGKVVESGTHSELLNYNGEYYRLYNNPEEHAD